MAMKWFWVLFVFVSSDIRAEDESTIKVFTDGQPIYADDVNENFAVLDRETEALAARVEATTETVDCNAEREESDNEVLQAALDRAVAQGSVVTVLGQCEGISVELNHDEVTLAGAEDGSTVLTGLGASLTEDTGDILTVAGRAVTIKNLTVEEGQLGIYVVANASVRVESVVARNNRTGFTSVYDSHFLCAKCQALGNLGDGFLHTGHAQYCGVTSRNNGANGVVVTIAGTLSNFDLCGDSGPGEVLIEGNGGWGMRLISNSHFQGYGGLTTMRNNGAGGLQVYQNSSVNMRGLNVYGEEGAYAILVMYHSNMTIGINSEGLDQLQGQIRIGDFSMLQIRAAYPNTPLPFSCKSLTPTLGIYDPDSSLNCNSFTNYGIVE